jgi:sec-independent protein translocase protein TatB
VFGIGWTEAVFIAIIVLLFVGPKHLPGMLRKAGNLVGELKKASRELQNQLDLETRDLGSAGGTTLDLRREARDLKRAALDLAQSPYEEARRMDEDLRRSLREAAALDAPKAAEGADQRTDESAAGKGDGG